MAFWNRNYDRDYGSYGRGYGYGASPGYERNYGYSDVGRPGMWGSFPEDRENAYYRGRHRYDEGYKSQWQTDNGDPYGDRLTHTPMRMIHGEYERPEHGYHASRYDRGYTDRGYTDRGYPGRGGYNRPDSYRGYRRGYDAGWY